MFELIYVSKSVIKINRDFFGKQTLYSEFPVEKNFQHKKNFSKTLKISSTTNQPHFFYYVKHFLPSGCHHGFGEDCLEWFVKVLQELQSILYKSSKEKLVDLEMGKRAENK